MSLNLVNLDKQTRQYMLEELELDLASDRLYYGKFLTEVGKGEYELFLREAIQSGNDVSLTKELSAPGIMKEKYERRKPKGGFTYADVPVTAAETLAEGEFNRFYARGLCRRATAKGISEVEVYRAKLVRDPRPESQTLIGKRISAARLLEDLRTNVRVDTVLGVPAGPNSGLSVRLPT